MFILPLIHAPILNLLIACLDGVGGVAVPPSIIPGGGFFSSGFVLGGGMSESGYDGVAVPPPAQTSCGTFFRADLVRHGYEQRAKAGGAEVFIWTAAPGVRSLFSRLLLFV